MFQFDNRRHRFTAHVFNRILVAQPIGAFDGIVHVKTPVIFAHVAQRGADAALCGDGMAAGREYFGETGCFQAFFRHAESGS